MADKKISALTGAATPLDGTEVLPIVQSGATVKVANNNLRPKQIQSNATSGVLQVAGPGAAATRVMTTPDENFTAARTDAAQTFNAVSSTNLFNGTGTEIVGFSKSAGARMYLRIASNVDESLTFVQSGGGGVLKIGSNYDVTVNSGNLVLGTSGKGITTGSAIPLGFGTNNTTTAMTIGTTGIVTMSAYGAGAATFSAAGVISSVSDENWKVKDGVPSNPTEMLGKLQPGYWYYNDKYKDTFGVDRQLGFYAQNVNAAIGPEAAPPPESITVKDEEGVETLQQKPWGYYDRSVLAVVVMTLQEALATVKALEVRIQALEVKS
jgi:hypothetical protein